MTYEAWNAGKMPAGARIVAVPDTSKPECAVHGMVRPGAMCSKVIVGGKLCGFTGQCEHQRTPGVGGNGYHTNCHEPLMKDDPT